MDRIAQTVPFGYEPQETKRRGTLIYYDSFDETEEAELDRATELARSRDFAKLVLYPLHEETVRRMTKGPVAPFYKREDRLHDWRKERGDRFVVVESWEGKRKKYTPLDSALRHLTETYPAPHFLLLSPELANLFASYSSFEDWITRIRLILTETPQSVHPKLEQFRHRWDAAAEAAARIE